MERAKQIFDQISRFVNGARPSEIKEAAALMSQDHPTLQQNTMGLVVTFMQNMANKHYVDARNEASKDMAIAMLNGYNRFLVDKFVGQGMTDEAARKQAEACMKDVAGNLPFI